MAHYYLSADAEIKKSNMNNYVAFAHDTKTDKIGYIKATEDSVNKTVELNLYGTSVELIPLLSLDPAQRDVMVIFGASGSGKSYLANKISLLYNNFYPSRKIYFITNNNANKDKALDHDIYIFLKLDDVIEKYSNEEELKDFKVNNEYNNSLIVFDDIDLAENIDSKRIFFAFLGVILKFKRKNNISVLYTTHHISDYKWTRELLVEQTCYIAFTRGLKNRSNRIYTDYLKLEKDEIDRIVKNNRSRWTCIKDSYKLVITEKEIFSLD